MIAQHKDKSGKFMPTEVKVGEEFPFSAPVPDRLVKESTCVLEALNWSKYGVKE
jgi:hypothetical protein